jgi:hypothetical protein
MKLQEVELEILQKVSEGMIKYVDLYHFFRNKFKMDRFDISSLVCELEVVGYLEEYRDEEGRGAMCERLTFQGQMALAANNRGIC